RFIGTARFFYCHHVGARLYLRYRDARARLVSASTRRGMLRKMPAGWARRPVGFISFVFLAPGHIHFTTARFDISEAAMSRTHGRRVASGHRVGSLRKGRGRPLGSAVANAVEGLEQRW